MVAAVNTNPIIAQVRGEGRLFLTEIESKRLLSAAGIQCIPTELATSEAEAIELSDKLGYPVALKIASPDIVHKSDSGGVHLSLTSADEVRAAYTDIMDSVKRLNPAVRISGAAVQPMAPPGVAVIIGMSKDAQFGPVIMFGLGGLLVEIIQDVSLRVTPLTRRDATEMMREVKGYQLLTGYRGQPPADLKALEDMLLALSSFVEANPVIKEIDLNPVIAGSQSAVAVDARVVLETANND